MTHEEALAVILLGERHQTPQQPQHRVLARLDLDPAIPRQLDSGVDEERTQNIEHPVEVLQECHAGENEDTPEDHRAHNAPEQDSMLVLRRDGEVREDQREDEDVVYGEAVFDEVAGDVSETWLRPLPYPQ